MAAIDWPATLPSFPLKSWSYLKKSSVIKSEMEIGPPKRRNRSTLSRPEVSGSLELDGAQLETFISFIEDDLGNGILPFNWPEFMSGIQKEVVLSVDTNGTLYTINQTGRDNYKVKLTLEIQP